MIFKGRFILFYFFIYFCIYLKDIFFYEVKMYFILVPNSVHIAQCFYRTVC